VNREVGRAAVLVLLGIAVFRPRTAQFSSRLRSSRRRSLVFGGIPVVAGSASFNSASTIWLPEGYAPLWQRNMLWGIVAGVARSARSSATSCARLAAKRSLAARGAVHGSGADAEPEAAVSGICCSIWLIMRGG
jgi:hypothetical protein